MLRALLILHGICGCALTGAATHEWLWSLRYLRGRFERVRQERLFLKVSFSLFAITYALGLILYPSYKVQVRLAHLDVAAPWVGRLFDIKEHAMALVLASLCAQLLLASRLHPAQHRRPALVGSYVALASWNAALIWLAAIVGLYTVSYRSLGGL